MKTRKEKKWVPEDGEMIYYINLKMEISYDYALKINGLYVDYVERKMIENGNCFRTKKEANEILRKIKKILKDG